MGKLPRFVVLWAAALLAQDPAAPQKSYVLGGGDVPSKPDPAGVRAILERVRARPEDTVFVGDSLVDARTAEAAGVAASERASPSRIISVCSSAGAGAPIAGGAGRCGFWNSGRSQRITPRRSSSARRALSVTRRCSQSPKQRAQAELFVRFVP